MISLIQSYEAQDVTIFDDIDAASFGFQEFLNVFDKDNITRFLHDTQTRHGFHIMQSSQKHQD